MKVLAVFLCAIACTYAVPAQYTQVTKEAPPVVFKVVETEEPETPQVEETAEESPKVTAYSVAATGDFQPAAFTYRFNAIPSQTFNAKPFVPTLPTFTNIAYPAPRFNFPTTYSFAAPRTYFASVPRPVFSAPRAVVYSFAPVPAPTPVEVEVEPSDIEPGYVARTTGVEHLAPLPEGLAYASHHINTDEAPGTE